VFMENNPYQKPDDMSQDQWEFISQSDDLEVNLPAGTTIERWAETVSALRRWRGDRPFRVLIGGEDVKQN